MNFRIKILGVLVLLCLLLCFMSNTYSRYVADTTGNLKMSFAQWQILVNNEDITSNSSSSVVLTPVIDENTNVKSNKIAPSSTGYFDISVDPSNVDVAFNYSIELDVVNEDIPDLIITKYAIIDSENENNIVYKNIENNLIQETVDIERITTPSDDIINTSSDEIITTSGDEIKELDFKPFVIRIHFEWYEGENEKMNDEADTLIGNDAENNDLQINAKIRFEQKLD